MIPKIAHRIWFGDPFPEKYRGYIKSLSEVNPDYIIKLWSDPITMSDEGYANLNIFCMEHRIELCNIREHTDLDNYPIIIAELDASFNDRSRRKLHYVRASDVARVAIKIKEGGVYTDTDSRTLAPFPHFSARHGFLLKNQQIDDESLCFFNVGKTAKRYQYYFPDVLYDFMACVPNHPLFKLAAQITTLDYRTYRASAFRAWEKSSNTETLAYGTVRLTGTAIKRALNYSCQSGEFVFNDPMEFFLETDPFMQGDYDKSWLEGFNHREEDEDMDQLDKFLDEIDANRQIQFPIIDHYMDYSIASLKNKFGESGHRQPDMQMKEYDSNHLRALMSESGYKAQNTLDLNDFFLRSMERREVFKPQEFLRPIILPALPQIHFDIRTFIPLEVVLTPFTPATHSDATTNRISRLSIFNPQNRHHPIAERNEQSESQLTKNEDYSKTSKVKKGCSIL